MENCVFQSKTQGIFSRLWRHCYTGEEVSPGSNLHDWAGHYCRYDKKKAHRDRKIGTKPKEGKIVK